MEWEFDKRAYVNVRDVRKPHSHRPKLPPRQSRGYVLQFPWRGKPVSALLVDSLTDMISRINSAIDSLAELPHPNCGWLPGEPPCQFGCPFGEICRFENASSSRSSAARMRMILP